MAGVKNDIMAMLFCQNTQNDSCNFSNNRGALSVHLASLALIKQFSSSSSSSACQMAFELTRQVQSFGEATKCWVSFHSLLVHVCGDALGAVLHFMYVGFYKRKPKLTKLDVNGTTKCVLETIENIMKERRNTPIFSTVQVTSWW